MLNRLPKRRSDRFIILDTTPNDTYEKWLYCDSCTERLVHRKKHDDLMCPNCGDVYPIDRGEDEYKNKGKLGTIEDNNSRPVILQPRNMRRTSLTLKQKSHTDK